MRATALLPWLLLLPPAMARAACPATHGPVAAAAVAPQDAAVAAGPTEKELLSAFTKAYSPSDAAARAAAITALGDASRALADGGAGRLVARALGKGLLDEELEVRAAAVSQLGWGRHVDSTIELLGESLPDLLSEIDRRLTRPDEESRQYVNRGTRLLGDACSALANYRDDRSVERLVTLLRSLDRSATAGNNLSARTVGPVARALLSLGTREAVETAVRQTQVYVGAGAPQQVPARELHAALAEFAVGFGQAPPDYSENVSVAWNQWWEAVGDRLPKSLGRLKLPPSSPPMRAMTGERARKNDGSAPRQ